MVNLTGIDALLERVKAATGPDQELDYSISRFVDGELVRQSSLHRPYTASIDDALALVERLLPGCGIVIDREPTAKGGAAAGAAVNGWIGDEGPEGRTWEHFDAIGSTFPLAILAALLTALSNRGEHP